MCDASIALHALVGAASVAAAAFGGVSACATLMLKPAVARRPQPRGANFGRLQLGVWHARRVGEGGEATRVRVRKPDNDIGLLDCGLRDARAPGADGRFSVLVFFWFACVDAGRATATLFRSCVCTTARYGCSNWDP